MKIIPFHKLIQIITELQNISETIALYTESPSSLKIFIIYMGVIEVAEFESDNEICIRGPLVYEFAL